MKYHKKHDTQIVLLFLVLMAAALMFPTVVDSAQEDTELRVLPAPKEVAFNEGNFTLTSARIESEFALGNEAALLGDSLTELGITLDLRGTPIKLKLGSVEVPSLESAYSDEIIRQAYRLTIKADLISIEGNSPQGVYYGIQTLRQLLNEPSLPIGEIRDWPDLPVRMIMIDSARLNENMDYYKRLIHFAASYKMNAILWHLTDDQTSALYLEDYPELLHHQAWKPEQINELIQYAKKYHVSIMPEIESLGHSRMFTRLPDFEDYLHQTDEDNPDRSWMGTDIPGYTNVLCPASAKAMEYLKVSYAHTSEVFRHPWLHIGFDEVDMTNCARCIEAFGELDHAGWLTLALQQAIELAAAEGERTALWGDMLLAHPEVADNLDSDDVVIFDWHYNADVDDESVVFFQERGFEVIACPALTCAPHMIMPDEHNFQNIARFSAIAREHDLMGVNTTIWVPTRYMSDSLWTGVAWSAAHAWGGENFNETQFYTALMHDYFGSPEGESFQETMNDILGMIWHRSEFNTSCWVDAESLSAARVMAEKNRAEVKSNIERLESILDDLKEMEKTVSKNQWEWLSLIRSTELLKYSMEHLLASEGDLKDARLVKELDRRCLEYLGWIEADWDKNRFSDDPGKEGRFLRIQHLYYRFRQMHEFHQQLLEAL